MIEFFICLSLVCLVMILGWLLKDFIEAKEHNELRETRINSRFAGH